MRNESVNHPDSSAPNFGWSSGIQILSRSLEVLNTFPPSNLLSLLGSTEGSKVALFATQKQQWINQ
jgi:hypothetical protein